MAPRTIEQKYCETLQSFAVVKHLYPRMLYKVLAVMATRPAAPKATA